MSDAEALSTTGHEVDRTASELLETLSSAERMKTTHQSFSFLTIEERNHRLCAVQCHLLQDKVKAVSQFISPPPAALQR